jgi:hypothetical protein
MRGTVSDENDRERGERVWQLTPGNMPCAADVKWKGTQTCNTQESPKSGLLSVSGG